MFIQSLTHQNTILSNRFPNAHDKSNINVRVGIRFFAYTTKHKMIAIIENRINIHKENGIHQAHALLKTPYISVHFDKIKSALLTLSMVNNTIIHNSSGQKNVYFFMKIITNKQKMKTIYLLIV